MPARPADREPRSLGEDDVDGALHAVRKLLVERQKMRVAWWVAESVAPAGLAALLRERGLRPYDEPPSSRSSPRWHASSRRSRDPTRPANRLCAGSLHPSTARSSALRPRSSGRRPST